MIYTCWKSDTCWVCQHGYRNGPIFHASSKGYVPTSACDTRVRQVEASSRKAALRLVFGRVRPTKENE